jgi:dihydroorotase
MKIAILGGRVINPVNQFDSKANVFIADGRIISITTTEISDFSPDLIIQAEDLIICPGLVDLNANILPASGDYQGLVTNLKKAAHVGITHTALTAFSKDHCLSVSEIEYLGQKKHNQASPYFIGALTQHLQGNRLNELNLLKEAGCIGFTNGYHAIPNTLVKRRCYDYASMLDTKIFMVLDDAYLSGNGCMHQGKISANLGLPGIPSLSEAMALAAELLLIEETGISAHFYRLSSKKAVAILEKVEDRASVSSDVAIHQLFLTDENIQLYDGLCHVRPPFRTESDKAVLRSALKLGIIDAISSDHIALPREDKEVPFQDAVPGIASWPLLLPLTLKLAEEEKIPLLQAMSWITSKPASILGINAGALCVGDLANVLVFNPDESWSLTDIDLKKFGQNNPFKNWLLQGCVKYTIVNGRLAYEHQPTV